MLQTETKGKSMDGASTRPSVSHWPGLEPSPVRFRRRDAAARRRKQHQAPPLTAVIFPLMRLHGHSRLNSQPNRQKQDAKPDAITVQKVGHNSGHGGKQWRISRDTAQIYGEKL